MSTRAASARSSAWRVLLASACIPAAPTLAGPGELDPTFGINGIVRIAKPPGNDNAAGVAALANRSVLVGC